MKSVSVQDCEPGSASRRIKLARAGAKAERAERDAELLTTLRFDCQATGRSFDYEVPGDAGTLKDLWSRELMLSCPHCREVHRFPFRPAYVRAMLDGPSSAFERICESASASV